MKKLESLSFFLLWESVYSDYEKILDSIDKSFKIIYEIDLNWTSENFPYNLSRLYRLHISQVSDAVADRGLSTGKLKLIIVETKGDRELYQTFSGRVEYVYSDIMNFKEELRAKYKNNVVHSANSEEEFIRDILLLVGLDNFHRIQSRTNLGLIASDLAGVNGWSSFDELFSYLNLTLDYVVLRNSQELIEGAIDKILDVDLLVSDQGIFLSISGASYSYPRSVGASSCTVRVSNTDVIFDATSIGDGYYCQAWQRDVIERRKFTTFLYTPSIEDEYFCYIYHLALHKTDSEIRKRMNILLELESKLSIKNVSKLRASFVERVEFLGGFLLANGYVLSLPRRANKKINLQYLNYLKSKSPYSKIERKKNVEKIQRLIEKFPGAIWVYLKIKKSPLAIRVIRKIIS